MLIGFNAASAIKTDLDGMKEAAHNEYIDLLLNVGIIGTIIMIVVILMRTLYYVRNYKKSGDEYSACMFMCKMVWFLYACTLTMFGDYRFMMIFLL